MNARLALVAHVRSSCIGCVVRRSQVPSAGLAPLQGAGAGVVPVWPGSPTRAAAAVVARPRGRFVAVGFGWCTYSAKRSWLTVSLDAANALRARDRLDPGPRPARAAAADADADADDRAEVRRRDRARIEADGGSVAVLYRTNSQGRAMEAAFKDEKLPYKIAGGESFYGAARSSTRCHASA